MLFFWDYPIENGHVEHDCEKSVIRVHCDTYGDVVNATWEVEPAEFDCQAGLNCSHIQNDTRDWACVPSKWKKRDEIHSFQLKSGQGTSSTMTAIRTVQT